MIEVIALNVRKIFPDGTYPYNLFDPNLFLWCRNCRKWLDEYSWFHHKCIRWSTTSYTGIDNETTDVPEKLVFRAVRDLEIATQAEVSFATNLSTCAAGYYLRKLWYNGIIARKDAIERLKELYGRKFRMHFHRVATHSRFIPRYIYVLKERS